jgi:hypothetical protein
MMNPQQALQTAELHALIPAVIGLILGVLIGVKSKDPISGGMIMLLGFSLAMTGGLIGSLLDSSLSAQFAGWIRVCAAGLITGIFCSRKIPGKQLDDQSPKPNDSQGKEEQE